MADTILVRCVDPRFETIWTSFVDKFIGPHYTLTELGGIDTLNKEGFNVLVLKIKKILGINPKIKRIVVLAHDDCAWCKAININEEEKIGLINDLAEKLRVSFPEIKVDTGKLDTKGKILIF